MGQDRPDNQIDGQMSIEDLFEPPERLFAVSRIFARARKEMSLAEQKTFVYALTEIRFNEELQSNIISVDKKTLAKILDLQCDVNHLSVNLFKAIKHLPEHSYIEINAKDIGFESNGFIVSNIERNRDKIELEFSQKYLKLFSGLTANYITLWSSDIFAMQSIRSVKFYEYLREVTDTRKTVNNRLLGIKALKELFEIPETGKNSYMRKDGHFDRPAFEKRIIKTVCDDMQHCKMIKLVLQPDGNYYCKEKAGNRVIGYRFYWEFSARPGIATAEEVQEIQERVDKDPQVLKVAKDIVNGKKKPKQQKKNSFTDFEQRSIDYGELERQLLRQQLGETSEKK